MGCGEGAGAVAQRWGVGSQDVASQDLVDWSWRLRDWGFRASALGSAGALESWRSS